MVTSGVRDSCSACKVKSHLSVPVSALHAWSIMVVQVKNRQWRFLEGCQLKNAENLCGLQSKRKIANGDFWRNPAANLCSTIPSCSLWVCLMSIYCIVEERMRAVETRRGREKEEEAVCVEEEKKNGSWFDSGSTQTYFGT